jgi:putative transposase
MILRKAFVFRLRPDAATEATIRRTAGCCRFIWNEALAVQKARLDRGERVQSYEAMSAALLEWKRDSKRAFLSEVHSQALQQKLRDFRRAFDDFFDPSPPGKKFPVFKKKSRGEDSFRYPQGVKIDNRRIYLPKVGWVRFHKSREIEGEIKNVTVKQRAGKWHVSVQTAREVADPIERREPVVGGDLGISRFLTLSDGTIFEPRNSYRKLEGRLAREQRKLSRKMKGSSNRKKQKAKIGRLHARIADARKDFLHKVSTAIAKTHGRVVLEDLAVKDMSASARGTASEPGRNVRQKARLNKGILDQGWGEFRRMLEYKMAWSGAALILVPPCNTSRTCSVCGFVMETMPLACREWTCADCGARHDRDLNAARNIEAAGHAVMACGSSPTVGRKQEPLEDFHVLQESSAFRP